MQFEVVPSPGNQHVSLWRNPRGIKPKTDGEILRIEDCAWWQFDEAAGAVELVGVGRRSESV